MSALIFVALAVGWAAYLIPRALRSSEETEVPLPDLSEHVDGARVLPRTSALTREAMALRAATVERPSPSPVALRRARAAARRAARRRMLVLVLLLLATATVGLLAGLGEVATLWVWAPAFLVACWLIVCRTAARAAAARVPGSPPMVRPSSPTEEVEAVVAPSLAEAAVETVPAVAAELPDAAELAAEPALWDPVPITLPTYVGKPAARRTVRTIELTGEGVTSSGHHAGDSELARDAAPATRAEEQAERRRAAG